MRTRSIAGIAFFLCLSGCGPGHFEYYQRLSEADRDLFARTRQFMTARQEEQFLKAPDSPARLRLVEELHIAERLNKFPEYIRQAIFEQRVVPGMSPEALLLAWGRPLEIERRDADGLLLERWSYRRAQADGRILDWSVYFQAGLVTDVEQR